VLARSEREAALLEGVDTLLRARAAAYEAYARHSADAAGALVSVLAGTGLGVGPTIHGAAKAGASNPIAAMKSAFRSAPCN
jgi:hypothetical protein